VRGSEFQVLIQCKGWEYVKAYYQSKVQTFATALLIQDQKSIVEFENERRELIGLRKLLGMIENEIKILQDYENSKQPTKK
jgi:hypothetical protein